VAALVPLQQVAVLVAEVAQPVGFSFWLLILLCRQRSGYITRLVDCDRIGITACMQPVD
jgi:hypothetical protein